jgi:hypothetical protein
MTYSYQITFKHMINFTGYIRSPWLVSMCNLLHKELPVQIQFPPGFRRRGYSVLKFDLLPNEDKSLTFSVLNSAEGQGDSGRVML